MCTLVALHRCAPGAHLWVAANRDEYFDRPAEGPALRDGVGGPIVAPSANLSGHVSATTAQHASSDLGDAVDMILDGGPAPVGLESTIVAIDAAGAATLFRPGAISREAIENVIGPVSRAPSGAIAAPGMMESHYAPRARLLLDVTSPPPGAM